MDEEKVSITGLLGVLYKSRKLILKITAVFLLLGIIVYAANPREYATNTVLLPESKSNSMLGNLSSLASLAGVNLRSDAGSSGINATLYEEILISSPFLHKLVSKEYYFPSLDKKMPLSSYLASEVREPILVTVLEFPKTAISWITGLFSSPAPAGTGSGGTAGAGEEQSDSLASAASAKDSAAVDTSSGGMFFNSNIINLSGTEKGAINELKKRIFYTLDIKTGLVKLTVELQDREVCAQLTKDIIDELTLYVSQYETQKERRNLQFVEQELEQAEERYLNAQMSLARFRDRNRNLLLSAAAAEGERLQARHDLEFNVYNSLREQREQLQIKVSEETPSLSVLEPPQVPGGAYKPNLLLILLITLFLGLFVGATYVLVKNSVIKIVST